MVTDDKIDLLARIARTTTARPLAGEGAGPLQILSLSAASFGSKPNEDSTIPTGFDPVAVSLFEAIVEGAYLVAAADGVFDDDERRAFERVVVAACGGVVAQSQVSALLDDLSDQLQEDGVERRIQMLSRFVRKPNHKREVVRVAALLAMAGHGVGSEESEVLHKLAAALGLDAGAVDAALVDAAKVFEAPPR